MKNVIALITTFIVLTGCATVEPYDYTAFKKYAPRSILVLPPVNNSVEVNAPYSYLSTITVPLAEKGYYVFPVSVIDTFMKENGLPTPMEMNNVPLEKIDSIIGADAVLYVAIDDWGQKYNVLSSTTVVKGTLRLVDVKSGELLWDSPIFAEYNPNNSGGQGLVGALVGAIASQIIGELADNTPQTARMANSIAINNQKRGLLNGPYKITQKKG